MRRAAETPSPVPSARQERADAADGTPRHDASAGPTAAGGRPVGQDAGSRAGAEPSRGAAIIAYVLVALVPVGLVLGPLGTLVLWRMRRGEPFVDHHARQALDIFLTALVVGGGLVVLARTLDVATLEWAGFAVVGAAFLLAVAGATMAARGSAGVLPVVPFLRRQEPADPNRQAY